MKGYIYTMFPGADPGEGWTMTDPLYDETPTMGACMPNIRRVVEEGDFIFSVSGRVGNVRQFVVGGFAVKEKIDALVALDRFPQNQQRKMPDGSLRGNIIVDRKGKQLPHDYHPNFEKRLENYIVGRDLIRLGTKPEIEIAREESAPFLRKLLHKSGKDVRNPVGRWRKLDAKQVRDMVEWMNDIKRRALGGGNA